MLASFKSRLQKLKERFSAPRPNQVDEDAVFWSYRLFLDRDPESSQVVNDRVRAYGRTEDLRREIMSSNEFRQKNPDLAYCAESTIVRVELQHGNRSKLFIDLSDQAIGLPIVRATFEPAETAFILKTVRPGMRCVDVGANLGYFTILMAERAGPEGTVYSYEPIERSFDLLSRSVLENGFDNFVQVFPWAVSDRRESLDMVYAKESPNHGGARLKGVSLSSWVDSCETVPAVSLDDEIQDVCVDFVKIDIEGAEPKAFRGMKRILLKDRPIILSEIHPDLLREVSGKTVRQYLEQMDTLGYDAHHLKPDGVIGAMVEVDQLPPHQPSTVVFSPTDTRQPHG